MWGTKIKDLPFKLVVQSEIEIWRAADFWTKERETIAWIDSFEPGSVFWDIGANIGVFSYYALTKKQKTKAFEPQSDNVLRILDSCMINNYSIQNKYDFSLSNYAISDFDGVSKFYVPKLGAGRSGGQIGAPKDEKGQSFTPAESYEVETYKIDTLAERLGVPNYIKIDVDGQEWRILQGGAETLANNKVQSVLVEVNNDHDPIEPFMFGLKFSSFNRFNGPDINRRANQKSRNVTYTR